MLLDTSSPQARQALAPVQVIAANRPGAQIEQIIGRVVPDGNIAVCFKSQNRKMGKARMFPRDRLHEAARYICRLAKHKSDIWYGVASYSIAVRNSYGKLVGQRTQENAVALKTLFIDVDVSHSGAHKTANFPDLESAVVWVKKFCGATALPLPNLWINSGYGLHLYWIVEDAMPVNEWRPYAEAFKAALMVHGFVGDLGVVADSARILRPPETYNYKDPMHPVEVRVVKQSGDFRNQEIYNALAPYLGQTSHSVGKRNNYGSSSLAGQPPAVMGGFPSASLTAARAGIPNPDMELIAPQCSQVARSLAVGGNGDGYDLWYKGFLTLAHFCADGQKYAHRLSVGDRRYDEHNVNRYIEQVADEVARKELRAPTCASFNTYRAGVCPSCSQFNSINSPISLGYPPAPQDSVTATTVVSNTVPLTITSIPVSQAADPALRTMRSTFIFIHDVAGEPLIAQRLPNGSLRYLTEEQLKRSLANRRVKLAADAEGKQRTIPLADFWLKHPNRNEADKVVFRPEGPDEPNTINTWTGLARRAMKGRCPLIVRHLLHVICDGDRACYRYVLRWLAHAIKHPGSAPGTVLVLRSDAEGAGKSFLLEIMARIFGRHGISLNTPEGLVGRFNDHLENVCFIGLNEPSFPGDHPRAAKLKSMITDSEWLIEGKFRGARRVPNIAHIAMTTNREWAVPAGNKARRFVVLDVSEKRVGDRAYFDALWHEADHGGIEAFLHLLTLIPVTNGDLREVPRTHALRRQQLQSADTPTRWAADAAASGELMLSQHAAGFSTKQPARALYVSYANWCDGMRQRPVSKVEFGRWLNRCGFQQTTLKGIAHYALPEARQFAAAVLKQAGIV